MENNKEKNWTDIHHSFNKQNQKLWENKGFTYETCKKLISKGLTPEDYDLAWWLINKRSQYLEPNLNVEESREKFEQYLKNLYQEWGNIHEEFKSGWAFTWMTNGLDYQQTKEWIEFGLKPKQYSFVAYLQKNNHSPQSLLANNNLEKLRDKHASEIGDWSVIHRDLSNESYKKNWEENDFTYQEVKEWISVGFKPWNYNYAQGWKNLNFTPQQTQSWIEKGLECRDYEFAFYLKQNNYQPNDLTETKLTELGSEFWNWIKIAQNWLNTKYPNQQKTKEIKIKRGEQLQDLLTISDYPNLETIDVSDQNNLTQLQIINCPKLVELDCNGSLHNKNDLNNLTITSCPNLKELRVPYSQLTDLDLTGAPNLEILDLSNNSLTSLNLVQNKKLKELDIHRNNNLTELNIQDCINLKELNCSDNQLTNLNLSNNLRLEHLDISNNNFLEQDLSLVSHLVNLKSLGLENGDFFSFHDKINQGIYNRFKGSLEPLKNMNKLESLWVSNTDLDSGLEFLPKNVKYFYCSADKRSDAKCKVIYNLFANEKGEVETDETIGNVIYISSIKNFSQKLQNYKNWKKFDFNDEEIKSWISTGAKSDDAEFIAWLRDTKNLTSQEVNDNNKKELRKEYNKLWISIHENFNEYYQQKWEEKGLTRQDAQEWIPLGFTPHHYKEVKEWKDYNFTPQETKSWIEIGLNKGDVVFATYLRDVKNYEPELIANYQEDYQLLSKRFRKYGWCKECETLNTGKEWCQSCNSQHLKRRFKKWTSGNQIIDEHIQKSQLEATDADKLLEWIPYEEFRNIEYLAEGGFGKIYKAEWPAGVGDNPIVKWNKDKNEMIEKVEDDIIKNYGKTIDKNEIKNIVTELDDKWLISKKAKQYIEIEIDSRGKCKWRDTRIPKIVLHSADFRHYPKEGKEAKRFVALKSLNNSQNITDDFLREIANHKLVESEEIVSCFGISQDPQTKDYIMIMDYIKNGDLRKYLQNNHKDSHDESDLKGKFDKENEIQEELTKKFQEWLEKLDFVLFNNNKKLELNDKIQQLFRIARGLNQIHSQGLVHRDLHAGNILSGHGGFYITDLGLCRPANETDKEKSYGVLPYVAPEVLRGQPYIQASDIYSFGIVAYELLSSVYPYADLAHDELLAVKICQGLRPNLDEVKIPQKLKDLIKKCWDADSQKRPSAEELEKTISGWYEEIKNKKTTPFYQQYQETKEEYNHWSQNTPYKINSDAIITSKMINAKEITQKLTEQYSSSLEIDFTKLSFENETERGQVPTEQNLVNWQSIHSGFNEELIQKWQSHGFATEQCRDWLNINSINQQEQAISEPEFYAWLRDIKNLAVEQVINDNSLDFDALKAEYKTSQQQPQIQQAEIPKSWSNS